MLVASFVIHDTFQIVAASEEMCELFRCDHEWFIDRSLIDLISDDEFGALAKLRMQTLRSFKQLHSQTLPLLRADGSAFWAQVKSYWINGEWYWTNVEYLYEV